MQVTLVALGPFPLTDGYVFRIEDGIEQDRQCNRGNRGNRSVNLTNLGIPTGEAREIENLSLPIAIRIDPELLTLWTGSNDIIGGDSVEGFEARLSNILQELSQETRARVYVGNIPNLTLLPRFREQPDNNVTIGRVQAFNDAIRRQTTAHNAILVDLFSSLQQDDTLVSEDGFHPNEMGHQRIANVFLSSILPQLCTSSPSQTPFPSISPSPSPTLTPF